MSAHFPVSDHCDGHRFFNPRGQVDRTLLDVLRWKFGSKAAAWESRVVISPGSPPAMPQDDSISVTWINHATFLIQARGLALITDPIFSKNAGPLGRLGPRRVHAPGIRFDDLPHLRAVLLSHDHYDHCDLPTLRRIASRDLRTTAIAPIGNGGLLRRAGFGDASTVELDWWESDDLAPDLHVQMTPARHWSNRLSGRRNGRLWGGFLITVSGRKIFFAGDTGYDDRLFHDIRERCGAPDLALLPIGGYEPRWFMAPQHCNPAEAVHIHRDLGARASLAMHWGTFPLTDEARDEPVRALALAKSEAGLDEDAFRVLQPGETVTI